MVIQREDLVLAADQGLLGQDKVEPLLAFLRQRNAGHIKNTPRFNGTHVLYYLGGMLAIGAASLFATLAVEAMGMSALLLLSLVYAACTAGAAIWFEKRGFGVPASIFATLTIALTPLAVFALQHVLGFWTDGGNAQHYRDYHMWIDWRWMCMEASTLVAGGLMLKRFRYPFLMLPVAMTLWYMSMDIASWIANAGDASGSISGWEVRRTVSFVFGLMMLLVALFVELRSRHGKDYAFWLYVFGLLTFWGSLSCMGSGELSGKLIYLTVNFVLVFIGAILRRRTFAVFGGMGIMLVLGDLSWHMFKDSLAFVLVLTLSGFALMGIGVWWSKYEAVVSDKLRAALPQDLRELLEARCA